jgi:hypothetical protein
MRGTRSSNHRNRPTRTRLEHATSHEQAVRLAKGRRMPCKPLAARELRRHGKCLTIISNIFTQTQANDPSYNTGRLRRRTRLPSLRLLPPTRQTQMRDSSLRHGAPRHRHARSRHTAPTRLAVWTPLRAVFYGPLVLAHHGHGPYRPQ